MKLNFIFGLLFSVVALEPLKGFLRLFVFLGWSRKFTLRVIRAKV